MAECKFIPETNKGLQALFDHADECKECGDLLSEGVCEKCGCFESECECDE
jgi:hypothetical protein